MPSSSRVIFRSGQSRAEETGHRLLQDRAGSSEGAGAPRRPPLLLSSRSSLSLLLPGGLHPASQPQGASSGSYERSETSRKEMQAMQRKRGNSPKTPQGTSSPASLRRASTATRQGRPKDTVGDATTLIPTMHRATGRVQRKRSLQTNYRWDGTGFSLRNVSLLEAML